ncbi:ribonuclease P protein component [Paenibacillus rhizoplanae]
MGISVSKKVGNAVVRNRMRRLVKEIVRHHEPEIAGNLDIVFIVRKKERFPRITASWRKSVLHVLRKAKLLKALRK